MKELASHYQSKCSCLRFMYCDWLPNYNFQISSWIIHCWYNFMLCNITNYFNLFQISAICLYPFLCLYPFVYIPFICFILLFSSFFAMIFLRALHLSFSCNFQSLIRFIHPLCLTPFISIWKSPTKSLRSILWYLPPSRLH